MEQPSHDNDRPNPQPPELQRWRLAQAGRIAEKLLAALNQNDEEALDDPVLSSLVEKVLSLSTDKEIAPFIGDEKPGSVSDIDIDYLYDNLGLSMKLYNSLVRCGYRTVGDLQSTSAQELLDCPGIGKNSIAELQRILALLGVSFRD